MKHVVGPLQTPHFIPGLEGDYRETQHERRFVSNDPISIDQNQ
jgi:hypothetical protein